MAVICKRCGGPHPIWECRKSEPSPARVELVGSAAKVALSTKSVRARRAGVADEAADGNAEGAEITGANAQSGAQPISITGSQPRQSHARFDKVAYQRNYMRGYRARKKTET